MTYKSRTENKRKNENMCNQWQTRPSEVVLKQMAAHSSNPFLYFVPSVVLEAAQLTTGRLR